MTDPNINRNEEDYNIDVNFERAKEMLEATTARHTFKATQSRSLSVTRSWVRPP